MTLNEYIELSKIFSSPKSRFFINGVLDSVVDYLKDTGSINKFGSGLL